MHPSRIVRVAAPLVAISAIWFAAPSVATAASVRFNQDCQAPAQPKSVAFVVAHVDRRPAGEFILTFENGEVWQQENPRTKLDIQRGEQVVIRRSTSGIYTLVARDGQSTRVVRVR